MWNVPMWTEADIPWLASLRATVAHHKRAAGAYPAGNGGWRTPFAHTQLFGELRHEDATHIQRLAAGEFIAQVASWSWIAGLPDDRRAAVLADVRSLLPDDCEIEIPWRTEIHWTRRR